MNDKLKAYLSSPWIPAWRTLLPWLLVIILAGVVFYTYFVVNPNLKEKIRAHEELQRIEEAFRDSLQQAHNLRLDSLTTLRIERDSLLQNRSEISDEIADVNRGIRRIERNIAPILTGPIRDNNEITDQRFLDYLNDLVDRRFNPGTGQ